MLDGVHYLMKTVAGVPNLRPVWFFDVTQQGEASLTPAPTSSTLSNGYSSLNALLIIEEM
jgi:hypothetical protein